MADKKKTVIGGLVSKSDIKNIDTLQTSIGQLTKSFENMSTAITGVADKLSTLFKNMSGVSSNFSDKIDKEAKNIASRLEKGVLVKKKGKMAGQTYLNLDYFGYEESKETKAARERLGLEQIKQKIFQSQLKALETQADINKQLYASADYIERWSKLQVSNLNLSARQTEVLRDNDEYISAYVDYQTQSVLLSSEQLSALSQSEEYLRAFTEQQISQNQSAIAQTQALAQSTEYINSILERERESANLNKKIEEARKAQIPTLQKIQSGVEKTSKFLKKFSGNSNIIASNISQIGSSLIGLFTVYKFVGYANDAKDAIGDWVENMNLFSIAFDKTTNKTYEWADNFAKKLGVARSEVTKILATFRELTETMGASAELADSMSLVFTELAYDLASVWDKSINEVTESMQSGIISGQIRTLRKFGIDISQESVQTLLSTNEALKKLNLSAANLSQSQKVLARTIITLNSVGTEVAGDMEKTINSLANRQRIFQAQLTELKTSLGAILYEKFANFYTYLTAIVKAINNVLEKLFKVSDKLKQISGIGASEGADTNKLTSEEFEQLKGGAWSQMSESEQAYMKFLTEARLESGLASKEMVDGQLQIVDTTDDMTEAQEQYNKTLSSAPFDKWQSLTSGSSSDVDTTRALMEEYAKSVAKYRQAQEEATKASTDQLDKLTEKFTVKLEPVIKKIVDVVVRAKPIVLSFLDALMESLPDIVSALLSVLKVVADILRFLDKMGLTKTVVQIFLWSKMLASVLAPITAIGGGLVKVYGVLKKFSPEIKVVTSIAKKSMSGIGKSIGGVLKSTNMLKASIMAISFTALVAGFTVLFSNKNVTAVQKIAIAVAAIAAGILVAVSAAKYGIAGAISAGMATAGVIAGVGTAAASALNRYETGGTPQDGELFYMNEGGRPEALMNTGGSKTSVINIDQLSEGMRRGFVAAINETGLASGGKIIVEGRNIDNNAVARGLFNSLEYESKRRGGNRL